jgi:hypothetical protein
MLLTAPGIYGLGHSIMEIYNIIGIWNDGLHLLLLSLVGWLPAMIYIYIDSATVMPLAGLYI